MTLLAIPNVSEGRSLEMIDRLTDAVVSSGARMLDVHSDRIHNRSVLTFTGDEVAIVDAVAALAIAALAIDLVQHEGVHPRLGVLDVCPVVPHNDSMRRAVAVAHAAGEAIATRAKLPVYFYGHAAPAESPRELPDIRRGGLEIRKRRILEGEMPDAGPSEIDPHSGIACVGARGPLIAFNVWLNSPPEVAREIAGWMRSKSGLPGVRAMGFPVGAKNLSQVSMNLIDPAQTGIDAAFEMVAAKAREMDSRIRGTEIVGLVPQEFMPDPKKEAARLLISPGRSVEAALV